MAVTVALAFAPELVVTIANVPGRAAPAGTAQSAGIAGLRGMAVPVLEGALDRSLQLAASMDARGYGRRDPAAARRRAGTVLVVAGLLVVVVGLYGVLDSGSLGGLGLPVFALGLALCAGLAPAGAGAVRAPATGRTRGAGPSGWSSSRGWPRWPASAWPRRSACRESSTRPPRWPSRCCRPSRRPAILVGLVPVLRLTAAGPAVPVAVPELAAPAAPLGPGGAS